MAGLIVFCMQRDISNLPGALAAQVGHTDLIVFDGHCVLCSGFFQFMLARDIAQRFRFATAQSGVGQQLYAALGLPLDDFETNLVIVDGHIFERLDAFAMAMSTLGWPWKALSALRYLPEVVKTPVYHLIARNRYKLFGRLDCCVMPSAELRARFIGD